MEKEFEILKLNRILVLKSIESLSINQLNIIPDGFKNNIAWNLAHLLVTQQLLCYKLSGLEMFLDQPIVEKYQKGSAPSENMRTEELTMIKDQFLVLVEKFREDYGNGIFKDYTSYKTSVNISLETIEDAIKFNNYHEGIHLGYILALKKLV